MGKALKKMHQNDSVGRHDVRTTVAHVAAFALLVLAAWCVRAEDGRVKAPLPTAAWVTSNGDGMEGVATVLEGVPARAARRDYLALTLCNDWTSVGMGVGCFAHFGHAYSVGAGSPPEDVARAINYGLFGGHEPNVGDTVPIGLPGGGTGPDGSAGVICWLDLDEPGGNPSFGSIEEFKSESWPGGGVGCVTVAPSPIGACSFDVPALGFDHGVVSVERPDEKSNTVTVTCYAPMSVRFVLAGGGSSVSGGPGISAEISLDKEALPVKRDLAAGKQSLTLSSTLTATREATAGLFSGAGVLKFEVD